MTSDSIEKGGHMLSQPFPKTCLSIILSAALFLLTAGFSPGEALTEKQILDGAGDRIEKHRKADAELNLVGPDGKPLEEGVEVRIEQTRQEFLFGCNIFKFDRCATPEHNRIYKDRFAEVFNFATLGFYWNSYESVQNRPDQKRWMPVARWCADNNIRAKGHPLLWTYEPRWLHSKTDKEAENLLWGRIEREIKAYAGLVDTWDVLNEPGVGIKQSRERNAVASLSLYERDGAGRVIQRAFARAREAGPRATLILNDFDTSAKYEKTIRESLAAQVSIDVIGIQSHMHGGYWGPVKTWSVCERFSQFDRPLHFTEATLISGPPRKWSPKRHTDWYSTSEGEKRQAEEVAEFYRVLFSHPAVEAITWWDFSDQGAWRGAPAGFLRDDMSPKPAYEILKNLVRNEWRTRTRTTLAPGGLARFRGFLGQYRIDVQSGGRRLTGSFALEKGGRKTIEVRLKESREREKHLQ